MNPVLKLVGLAGAGAAATALLAAPAKAVAAHHADTRPPVFVQTDDPAGNTVLAYDRMSTGSLVAAGTYATGGHGGILAGAVVDHTASQGALAYDTRARLLLAANAGSDTITTFAVHGDRLVRRQVLSSGGTFPVSIAVHDNRVYILNARNGGSIQGYLRIGDVLVRIPWWHRNLGLDPNQTPEFISTPGQIAFSPEGNRLIVTTKNGDNSVDVFHLGLGGPAAPTVTSLPGAVPFSVSFDGSGHLAVTEAGPNAVATFTVNRDEN